jgi:hypothetical protein
MKNIRFVVLLALTSTFTYSRDAYAMGFAASPLVDHPVLHPLEGRSPNAWRSNTGTWGENFVEETLRLRGFDEIYEIKNTRNNGVDRIAIKRSPNGEIFDVKLIEVKTTRSKKIKVGSTKYGGKQMSKNWLNSNLRKMRQSGNVELKKLALEISLYRKLNNLPINRLGEIVHINTYSGKIIAYAADNRTIKYNYSIEKQLRRLQVNGSSQSIRNWATRNLAALDQIRSADMASWLEASKSERRSRVLLANSDRWSTTSQSSTLLRSRTSDVAKLLRKHAGKIALVVSLAMDSSELIDTEYAYRTGIISARRRNIQLLSSAGGMAGAFAGSAAGGYTGSFLGSFGGPIAWFTIPAGGLVGSFIGGVGGYYGGSNILGSAATMWYDTIDESLRDKFERSWLSFKEMP